MYQEEYITSTYIAVLRSFIVYSSIHAFLGFASSGLSILQLMQGL